jgi:hypothetical protein
MESTDLAVLGVSVSIQPAAALLHRHAQQSVAAAEAKRLRL